MRLCGTMSEQGRRASVAVAHQKHVDTLGNWCLCPGAGTRKNRNSVKVHGYTPLTAVLVLANRAR